MVIRAPSSAGFEAQFQHLQVLLIKLGARDCPVYTSTGRSLEQEQHLPKKLVVRIK